MYHNLGQFTDSETTGKMLITYVIVCIASIPVLVVGYLYYKFRIANRLDVPADVVVLYQVGRGPRAPSFSPFPMKLETFLRMTNIPYMNDHSGRFSHKGKTPWIQYNGTIVADSQLAIEFLKSAFDVDPNISMTEEDKAIARAFLKLTEENLYWTMCLEMFGEDLGPVKSVIPYRGFKLWSTLFFLKRVIAKEAWGHGIGRHSDAEVWDIARKDLDALSKFLGEKAFFMGTNPTEVDCAIFGMLAQAYWHMPGSRHHIYMKESLPNLVDYIYRMKDRYWPDWDHVTLEGQHYSYDHGRIYNSKG